MLPLKEGPRYLTNKGKIVTFTDSGNPNSLRTNEGLTLYFDKATGEARGTDVVIVKQLNELTLPPVVGKEYYYRKTNRPGELYKCTITEQTTHRGDTVYRSKDNQLGEWTYWSDGQAKTGVGKEYVAELVADVELSAIDELRAKRDSMMKRLAELEA